MPMIEIIVDADEEPFEPPQLIDAAVKAACSVAGFTAAEPASEPKLCIRFASDHAIRALNKQWRSKDAVTDVLAFPMQQAPFDWSESLGDIALAAPLIQQEAARLDLAVHAHTLHLIIHATLHLLGFDHIQDHDASIMQKLENAAMQEIGLHRPYAVEHNPMAQA
ncbi:MAG: rRNA maturation RNase YbeY [Mariprofundus sp.]|nr:rRNA maturation RNase YbeY [Mariprofundus sp.]